MLDSFSVGNHPVEGLKSTLGVDESLLAFKMRAFTKAYAYIEFDAEGVIQDANTLFLKTMGYSLGEIKGKHHSLFCDRQYVQTLEYRQFWQKLNRGEVHNDEFSRFSKDGQEIWLKACYLPVQDSRGRVLRVMKMAQNITDQKRLHANYEGQIAAINLSQAVIEFDMSGIILTANQNFLNAVGYQLQEIQGQHHRIFCDAEYVQSLEYRRFWEKLNQGLYDSGEYRRIGKQGKSVWIQASYNPICDLNGKPFKVVKYAADITEQKTTRAHVISQLTSASRNLNQAAQQLNTIGTALVINAQKTSAEANAVVCASSEISGNIQSCASAAEEMEASVREIAQNSSEAATVSHQAVSVVDDTNQKVQALGQSSTEIGQVVKVINSIAQQTNLLALNATIEAARAGEAGKGFAVVAHEVKELARKTTHATEDISQKIQRIQSNTKDVMTGISQMRTVIEKVNAYSAGIAAAVDEQTATTSEITRSMNLVATAASEITQNTAEVVKVAENTATTAGQTRESATELTQLAGQLNQLIRDLH